MGLIREENEENVLDFGASNNQR